MCCIDRTSARLRSNSCNRRSKIVIGSSHDVAFVSDFSEQFFQEILADNWVSFVTLFTLFFFLMKILNHLYHIFLSRNSFKNRCCIGRL